MTWADSEPIIDSYLILKSVRKKISTPYGSSLGFIEQEDLLYIERKLDIVGVDTDSDDEYADDGSIYTSTLSSIPGPRSYPHPDSNDKVTVWITKSKLN
jgi:hypothetical protein